MLTITTLLERFDEQDSDEITPIRYVTGVSYDGSVCLVSFRYGSGAYEGFVTVQNESDFALFWQYNRGVNFYPVSLIPSNLSTYHYPRKYDSVLDENKVQGSIDEVNQRLITQVFPKGEVMFYKTLLKAPLRRIYATKVPCHVRANAAHLFIAMKERYFTLPQIVYGGTEPLVWDAEDRESRNFTLSVLTDSCLFERGDYFLSPRSCFEFLSLDEEAFTLNVRITEARPGTGLTQTEEFIEWMAKKGEGLYMPVSPDGIIYMLSTLERSFQRHFAQ